MANFPRTEAEIASLTEAMLNGFADNAAIYPSPPVAMMDLGAIYSDYRMALNHAIATQAAAEQATTDKDEKLEALIDGMKTDIRYAENTVDYDDDKLKLIGWAGRRQKTPLAVPGQARLLEAPRQGEGWVYLDWKAPVDGGKPSAYRVVRRERDGGSWEDVATAIITEVTLVDQPRGKELEYNIVAVNKSGDGEASNTVMVVL